MNRPFKIPESVLVVIYTAALDVLLIERTDKAGYWQSVTGKSVACKLGPCTRPSPRATT